MGIIIALLILLGLMQILCFMYLLDHTLEVKAWVKRLDNFLRGPDSNHRF